MVVVVVVVLVLVVLVMVVLVLLLLVLLVLRGASANAGHPPPPVGLGDEAKELTGQRRRLGGAEDGLLQLAPRLVVGAHVSGAAGIGCGSQGLVLRSRGRSHGKLEGVKTYGRTESSNCSG